MGFVKGLELKPPLLLQKQWGGGGRGWGEGGTYRASDHLPSDQGEHRGEKNPFWGLWLFRLSSLITKLWNLGRCSRFCLLMEHLFFGRTQSNHYFELPARSACVIWTGLWQKQWKYQKVIKAMRCVFACKISLKKIKAGSKSGGKVLPFSTYWVHLREIRTCVTRFS